MRKMRRISKVFDIAYHRNGMSGNRFDVVLFETTDRNNTFLGIVFEEPGDVAVLKLDGDDSLDKRVIEFGRNSWRGDEFEEELRKAIADAEEWRMDQEEEGG